MKASFAKTENTNKAIFLSMSFSLLAKIFNFAQSLVVSYAFGTQTSTDILFYMLSMVILFSTLLSAVNQQVIVPNVIHIRTQQSEQEARRFISYVYFIYLLAGSIVTALLILWPDRILGFISRLQGESIANNMDILTYIMPTFLLIAANAYILDIFTAYRYFTVPMVLEMVKNLVIILIVFLFRDVFSVASLAIGVLAGNLLQFVILNTMLFSILKCKPSFHRFTLGQEIKKNISYVLIGHFTTFASGFAVMYLMSGFSAGVYSAQDYSQKITTVFSLVIIGQITTVVGMNLIELHEKGEWKKLSDTFAGYLKMSLFFIIPFSFLISLHAEGIISLLFERGRFTRESVEVASGFLRYFAVTLPYLLVNSFIVRLIIAKQIQRIAFWWQVSQSIGNILVYWIMIRLFGYMGYPAGGVVASYVYIFLLLHFLLKHQFVYIDRREVIRYFLFNTLLTFALAAGFYLLGLKAGADGSIPGKLAGLTGYSLAFLLVYVLAGYFTGINREVIRKLLQSAAALHSRRAWKAVKE